MNSRSLDSNRLLDVSELAERLGVPKGWVYRAAEQQRIPSLKVGKYRRFNWQEVHEALQEDKGM